jgi:hypothetical protein
MGPWRQLSLVYGTSNLVPVPKKVNAPANDPTWEMGTYGDLNFFGI